jgi:hypothetical protein
MGVSGEGNVWREGRSERRRSLEESCSMCGTGCSQISSCKDPACERLQGGLDSQKSKRGMIHADYGHLLQFQNLQEHRPQTHQRCSSTLSPCQSPVQGVCAAPIRHLAFDAWARVAIHQNRTVAMIVVVLSCYLTEAANSAVARKFALCAYHDRCTRGERRGFELRQMLVNG